MLLHLITVITGGNIISFVIIPLQYVLKQHLYQYTITMITMFIRILSSILSTTPFHLFQEALYRFGFGGISKKQDVVHFESTI